MTKIQIHLISNSLDSLEIHSDSDSDSLFYSNLQSFESEICLAYQFTLLDVTATLKNICVFVVATTFITQFEIQGPRIYASMQHKFI